MQMSGVRRVSERIAYLPASEEPLSADVGVIESADGWWIYDVGRNDASAAFLNELPGKKRIVLSHFHADHTANLSRVQGDELYVGAFTRRKFGLGTIVDREMTFESGVSVFPLPSSHAKGSVGLRFGDYAFLGDGTYAAGREGGAAYNAGQLQGLIAALEAMPVRWFLLSHREPLAAAKEELLAQLKAIYARREKDSAYIFLP